MGTVAGILLLAGEGGSAHWPLIDLDFPAPFSRKGDHSLFRPGDLHLPILPPCCFHSLASTLPFGLGGAALGTVCLWPEIMACMAGRWTLEYHLG